VRQDEYHLGAAEVFASTLVKTSEAFQLANDDDEEEEEEEGGQF
jgi:hypothetical protein